MTLVLSVHGRDSLWVLVDRRLSYADGRLPIDDAMKVMHLETDDGTGLLAYAGLGATPRGTQPSEWMSAVLRGRGGLTFEGALGALSDAANRELPKHLAGVGGAHFVVIPAFIRGVGFRLYSIENVLDVSTGQAQYRFTCWQPPEPGRTVRLAVAGSGGQYLVRQDPAWQRTLLSLVKAHDRGKAPDVVIADALARLNDQVHHNVRDGSVGPRCIVARIGRQDAQRGGGLQFYTGIRRDPEFGPIPAIANGLDVQAIIELTSRFFDPVAEQVIRQGGPFELDMTEMDKLLAELPSDPDEILN